MFRTWQLHIRPLLWCAGALLFLHTCTTVLLAIPHEMHPLHRCTDWRTLNQYQHTISEATFRDRLKLFSHDGAIYQFLTFHPDHSVSVYETPAKKKFLWRVYFASTDDDTPTSFRFKQDHITDFIGATWEQPLKGLRIGIDPGHIGGEWSKVEERHMKYRSYPVVKEGDLTLITARHLADRLRQAGAEIVFTRTNAAPVTRFRPADFNHDALEWAAIGTRSFSRRYYTYRYRWYRNFLFYRVAEVAARADLLSRYDPDFTICIHYNAAPWPGRKVRLYNAKKLVAFVHGSYSEQEIASPTQKIELFRKLFEYVAPVEIEIADALTNGMREVMNMPPEDYSSWPAAHRVNDNPYVWSRNVIANRLFPGPVIFAEGPYMNDTEAFYRIQAGDYEGVKTIRGKEFPSIHREFAGAMAGGLIQHYRQKLQLKSPEINP